MQQDELQNLIAQKTMLGMSHQEIYEELDAAFPGHELLIASCIAELPTIAQRKQYGIWRYLTLGLTAVGVSLSIYDAVVAFVLLGFQVFPLVESALALGMLFLGTLVWRWRTSGFTLLGYLSGILLGFALVFMDLTDAMASSILQLGVYGLLSILGLMLGHRLGGKYRSYAPTTQVRNERGEIRTRFKIKFLD